MKKCITTVIISCLLVLFTPALVKALDFNVSPNYVKTGQSVSVSGTDAPDRWITIKVLDQVQNIVFFDAVPTDANGGYSCMFKVPDDCYGLLYINAGYADTVESAELNVIRPSHNHSNRGSSVPSPVKELNSNIRQAELEPAAGGIVKMGSQVVVDIPAGALKGDSDVKVEVEKLSSSPEESSAFRLLGEVYEFRVNGAEHYKFNKPLRLSFTFDPQALTPDEKPEVHYYDESSGQWISLGGTVRGNTISVTVDHFTKFTVIPQKTEVYPSLTDISGHWAEDSIKELVSLAAISGYTDSSFKSDNIISRAEFATVLVKALKLDPKEGKIFKDTAKHWAKDYIATAAAYGIVSGYDAETFRPDDPINREQIAVMTVKAATVAKTAGSKLFADSRSISDWARDAVAICTVNKIISGYPDNTFRPQANASRAEAVSIISRVLR